MLTRATDFFDVITLAWIELGFQCQMRHPYDGIHWSADFMAHIGKKIRFHARSILCFIHSFLHISDVKEPAQITILPVKLNWEMGCNHLYIFTIDFFHCD